MDITTVPFHAHRNEETLYNTQVRVDKGQELPEKQSFPEYDPDWLFEEGSTASRERSMTYPRTRLFRPITNPQNLAFGRNWSCFIPNQQSNEPTLQMQVKEYNRTHESLLDLHIDSLEDQVYSGLLQFQFFNGSTTETKNLHVRSTDTAGDLIPELVRAFLYQSTEQLDGNSPHNEEYLHSYIALVQGELERELDVMEKPLQIALDCSSKRLASPKFLFKSPLPEQSDTPSTPHQTNHFTSYLGSLALHSGSSENGDSPFVTRNISKTLTAFDQSSMNSFDSALSLHSSKNNKSKSTSSLVLKSKKKKQLAHTLSNQETGVAKTEPSPSSSPIRHYSQAQISDSPSPIRKQGKSKSVVTNFITRSLRIRKKGKQTNHPQSESPEEIDGSSNHDTDEVLHINGLVSPLPLDRKFTMSAVMHIYYMKPKQIQLYKSVLVSEKATTREVISQALERYNMKLSDPDDFGLYEVVGKWQDITNTLPSRSSTKQLSTLPAGMVLHNPSPTLPRRTSVEEFVICYSRELEQEEFPYNVQFFMVTREGYTRRFELRSKSDSLTKYLDNGFRRKSAACVPQLENRSPVKHRSASITQINITPESVPCIFGQTVNRKRAKLNRISPTKMMRSTGKDNPNATCSIAEERGEKSADRVQNEHYECILDSDSNSSPGIYMMQIHQSDTPTHLTGSDSLHDSGTEHQTDPPQTEVIQSTISHNTSSKNSVIMADLSTPFLLSVRVFDPEREPLVYQLTRDRTLFLAENSSKKTGSSPQTKTIRNEVDPDPEPVIVLNHPDLKGNRNNHLCSICHQPLFDSESKRSSNVSDRYFSIKALSDSVQVSLNGKDINGSSLLKHGDIIGIGGLYMFVFQEYNSLGIKPPPKYNWEPLSLDSMTIKPRINKVCNDDYDLSTPLDRFPQQHHPSDNHKVKSTIIESSHKVNSSSRSASETSLTVEEFEPRTIKQIQSSHHATESHDVVFPEGVKYNAHSRLIRQVFQAESKDVDDDQLVLSMPSHNEVFVSNESTPPLVPSPMSNKKHLKKTSSLPSKSVPRKMMFSFSLDEEEHLLELLVSQFDPKVTKCQLAPSYIVCMCIEYGMMCFGPQAMTAFVKKTINSFQSEAWDSCKQLTEWQINIESAQKPLSIMKELFVTLEPVLLWLANSLEVYNFLSTNCDSLNLNEPSSPLYNGYSNSTGQDDIPESALSVLYNVLVYTFQQAFYSVSTVLCHSLPVMLDGCTEDKLTAGNKEPIVIDQAVEFLQALLDLFTKLHIHLEVISQLFTNVFFFTNAVMFNALMEQGGELSLYQNASGKALRANLNLLEGWACQVGLRDNVLHYLAKFSGAVDLLATPPQHLLQMDWCQLRKEFPVLRPAQLHYILVQYLLPYSVVQVPNHWTPSSDDAVHAVKTSAVKESFDSHPSFELPSNGYTLDLTKPPPEANQFQAFIDCLRKQLNQKNQKASNFSRVTVKESESTPQALKARHKVVTSQVSNTEVHSVREIKPFKVRTLHTNDPSVRARRNIGSNTESQEDLLQETKNNQRNSTHMISERIEHQEFSDTIIPNSHQSFSQKVPQLNGKSSDIRLSKVQMRVSGRDKVVERVHSMITPRSFDTPEKFLLEPQETNTTTQSWLSNHFPPNAKMVTVPRGDKGFGLIMVEAKDPRSNETGIFIQGVLPGSTGDMCRQIYVGDRILAIDGQLLDGADYVIAEKYLKDAEEDVSLVILPSYRTNFTL